MEHNQLTSTRNFIQFTTFQIEGYLYGIDVIRVQEIVRPMRTTAVPLSQSYVKGLINLRGQVATAIELRSLLDIHGKSPADSMNVVCRTDHALVSFLVDKIGDVIEVPRNLIEGTPHTIPIKIRELISGVIKTNDTLLSIIDVDKIMSKLAA